MDQEKTSWSLIVGITAGVVGGIIAGVYLYTMHSQDGSDLKIRDAKDIISHCQDKIKEIEAGIEALKQPITSK